MRTAVFAVVVGFGTAACGGRGGASSIPTARADDDNRQGAFEFGRGDLLAAEKWFQSALERSRAIDDDRGQAIALLNLSRVDGQRWRLDRAERRAKESLSLVAQPQLRGAALSTLSSIRSQRGDHRQAIADAREARALVASADLRRRAKKRLAGDRATTLAYALIRAGAEHCAEAERVLGAAPDLYGRTLDDAGRAALAHLGGRLALGRGDVATATARIEDALRLDRARGRPLHVAADLEALADAAHQRGDGAAATTWLSRALSVREAIDTPEQALAVAQRIVALGGGTPQLEGRIALLGAELSDAAVEPPVPANACR